MGGGLPGFLDRDEVVAHHEAALGRAMVDLAWHEGFALARSAAVAVRTGIVAALAAGDPLPDPVRHPVVRYAAVAHA
jgi:hypothetical protein